MRSGSDTTGQVKEMRDVLVVVSGSQLDEAAARLDDAGIATRRCRPDELRAEPDRLAGAGYVLAHCPNEETTEAYEDLELTLLLAGRAGVPVGVVFQRIDDRALSEIVMRREEVDVPLDERSAADLDPELVRPLLIPPDAPDPHALVIGGLLPMPTGTAEYEGQRTLSLASPSMRAFITRLRAAVRLMDRVTSDGQHLRPPWDPDDRSPSHAVREQDGEWQLRTPRGGGRPNLHDVLLAHATESGRALLDGRQAELDGPAWSNLPHKLLILGESGTGKSLVAGLTHQLLTTPPHDSTAPFERISCGGLEVDRVQHELFGSDPDAYTGVGATAGTLLRASYGTAFFDEVGDLPLDTQARLLTFLDDLVMHPAGIRPFPGYVQIVAATNRDLRHRTAQQAFRHDLLARFQLRVTVPPLRERRGEIRQLVDFVSQNPQVNPANPQDGGRVVTHISPDAIRMLEAHDYRQGNFRELEEAVTAGIDRARESRSPELRVDHLALDDRPTVRSDADTSVVQVTVGDAADLSPTRRIEVDGMDELRRLAGRRRLPILIGREARSAALVVDGDIGYLADTTT